MLRRKTRLTPALLIAASMVGLAGGSPAQTARPEQATPAPAPLEPLPQRVLVNPRAIDNSDDLLLALETADKDLRQFSADVRYAKKFSDIEGGDKQTWQGKLYFDVEPGRAGTLARKRFAVIFDTLIVGADKDAVKRKETKHLIFDGEWFVERNEGAKQFTKRRVVAPGERADPLKLGEGPFPLPIGQKRDDILRRFDAYLVAFDDGMQDAPARVKENYRETLQLKLIPRIKGREARDFAEIRIWYRRSDLLPRLARTRTAEGSEAEILLINQSVVMEADPTKRVAGSIDPSVFDTTPPKDPSWNVDVREQFRAPANDDGTAPTSVPPGEPKPQAKPDRRP